MFNSIIKLIRVHQYVKNFIILLPLFFAGNLDNTKLFFNSLIAIIAFSFSASSVYILNDYLDVEHDKNHPVKKHRPLASGAISKKTAVLLLVILLIISILIMFFLSKSALLIMLTYLLMNLFYCFYLKHVAIIDIVTIAIGFVLRLLIGSLVTGVELSKWIIIMLFLLALFLAIAKRRDDVLHFINTGKKMRKVIDGYNLNMIDSSMMIMASIVCVSYLLYTTSEVVVDKFNNDNLYLTFVFVFVGILRYLQITLVFNKSGSPTKVLIKDKFTIINLIAWVTSFAYLIYFS